LTRQGAETYLVVMDQLARQDINVAFARRR
jgi:hypothetical protein